MNINDKKIQELFAKVQAKKSEIQKAERPTWKTNCSFSVFPGAEPVNIQTLTDIDALVRFGGILFSYQEGFKMSASYFSVEDKKCYWSGYTVQDWLSDFSTRISKIKIQDKKSELAKLEERLNQIVSPELRATLEIEAITKELGE